MRRWLHAGSTRKGSWIGHLLHDFFDYRDRERGTLGRRIFVFRAAFFTFAMLVIGQLFRLQVIEHHFYRTLASGEHELYRQLFPKRGDMVVRDASGAEFPVATSENLTLVWANVREVRDPTRAAYVLADALGLDELTLKTKLSASTDPYEPLAHLVTDDQAATVSAANLAGIHLTPETHRVYPERSFGGQVLGFLGADENGDMAGRYGLEHHYDEVLRGERGFLAGERDPSGRLIAVAGSNSKPAADGADLILTIDRTIQSFVCDHLRSAVTKHGADNGSVVILEPKTGAVLAMCGAPDFDPNHYRDVKDVSVFNNQVLFDAYEPGSVFKPITMAAAIDTGAVGPQTTYVDTGLVQFGSHTIRNSDHKAHGLSTMTQVLEQSLNTGAIFAMQQTGFKNFVTYVQRFGFGAVTGIDDDTEVPGNTSALKKPGEIYDATASFGQGITVTPIQIASAFSVFANGGTLVKPYVVAAMRFPNGKIVATIPEVRGQVISPHTATILTAMLTSVVERGHGKRAGVPGYYIAGKTGTAQVPRKDGPGYEVSATNGTFAGFGPVEDPKFVMVVRMDHPRDVTFAESSAAPLFGEIAKFLLQYYRVPPTRPVK